VIFLALRVRSRLGKYRILSRIGEGGFCDVFAAFDTIEGQRVALKVPNDVGTRDTVKLLRKEIRMTVRLDHPNVLPIRNADEIDGRLVIAHPLGDESLAERLHRRIAVRTALEIFEQLLSALAYAHQKRIMHCDVKPGNVILFSDGTAQLGDFGLARSAQRTILASGSGTLGYMAPEQAMGRPSFRSDVFSAAMVLYRMLTGRVPEWPFKWPMVGHDRLEHKVSPGLIKFLRKALQVEHRQRYANCVSMLHAYKRIRPKVKPKKRKSKSRARKR